MFSHTIIAPDPPEPPDPPPWFCKAGPPAPPEPNSCPVYNFFQVDEVLEKFAPGALPAFPGDVLEFQAGPPVPAFPPLAVPTLVNVVAPPALPGLLPPGLPPC